MTVLGMTYAGSVPHNPQLPARRESTVKAQPVLRVDFGVQRRQAHDSLKFQSVDGACVFLGCLMELCPSNAATVFMFAPLLSILSAKL